MASWSRVWMNTLGDARFQEECLPAGSSQCWGPAGGGSVLRVSTSGLRLGGSFPYTCRFAISPLSHLFLT